MTIKIMTNAEKKALEKAAKLLYESNCISGNRLDAIYRTIQSKSLWRS